MGAVIFLPLIWGYLLLSAFKMFSDCFIQRIVDLPILNSVWPPCTWVVHSEWYFILPSLRHASTVTL